MEFFVDAFIITANSVVHYLLTLYFPNKKEDLRALYPRHNLKFIDVISISIFDVDELLVIWCHFRGIKPYTLKTSFP